MFDIKSSKFITIKVLLEYNGDDGESEQSEFKIIAKRLSLEKIVAIESRFNTIDKDNMTGETALHCERLNREVLHDIVTGWEDIVENGKPVTFTKSRFDELLDNYHGASAVIINTYCTKVFSRIKN